MKWMNGLALLFLAASCTSVPSGIGADPYGRGGVAASVPRQAGSEIMICGQRVEIGAPVVLWEDPGGYNAYGTTIRVGTNPTYIDEETGRRYLPGRRAQPERDQEAVSPGASSVQELGHAVDQFVLHYDVCGNSRTCFEVLHHRRGLSVHFLLDIDGTLYQTLDLQDTAWHATKANSRSIGIEIAQIGARPPSKLEELDEWYSTDGGGVRLILPERHGDGGVLTQDFIGRPASPEMSKGRINGTMLLQHDFTPQQYETLGALLAVLTRELPGLPAKFPVDATGDIIDEVLTEEEFEQFSGILGHYHVQVNKTDPGPAFDWLRLKHEIATRR